MTLLMREREKYKEGRAEGRAEGRVEGRAEGMIGILLDQGCSSEYIVSILQKKLDIDSSQAEDYLKRFCNDSL